MKVLAAPSPTPAPTGRLREWNGGVSVRGHSRTLAQAKALIAGSGTGVRDLVGVIVRERCAVVSTLEQA